jgi:hypothetical protein
VLARFRDGRVRRRRRHRRRGPRPRRRSRRPGRQLRLAARRGELRPPHRPHRARRARGRGHLARVVTRADAAHEPAAQARSDRERDARRRPRPTSGSASSSSSKPISCARRATPTPLDAGSRSACSPVGSRGARRRSRACVRQHAGSRSTRRARVQAPVRDERARATTDPSATSAGPATNDRARRPATRVPRRICSCRSASTRRAAERSRGRAHERSAVCPSIRSAASRSTSA